MMTYDEAFVGIDVSKDELEICEKEGSKTFTVANGPAGWAKLVRRWRDKGLTVGIEPSGGYERGVVVALVGAGIDVRWTEPKRVRALAVGLGVSAKTDPIDSGVIRLFVKLTGGAPVVLRPEEDALRQIVEARQAAMASGARLRRQAESLQPGPGREALERLATAAEAEVQALTPLIHKAVAASEALAASAQLMQTVPGVGPLVAAELLATLPELGQLSAKAIARLAGLAPFIRKSGKWIGKAKCSGGRPRPRSALYLAAMASLRAKKGGLRPTYEALVARGKPRMVALTACMRKLLVTLNAMLATQQPYRLQTS